MEKVKDWTETVDKALESLGYGMTLKNGGERMEKICGYCKNARTEVLLDGRTVLVCELTKHIVSGRDDCAAFEKAS